MPKNNQKTKKTKKNQTKNQTTRDQATPGAELRSKVEAARKAGDPSIVLSFRQKVSGFDMPEWLLEGIETITRENQINLAALLTRALGKYVREYLDMKNLFNEKRGEHQVSAPG